MLSFTHYYPPRSGRDPISRHPCRGSQITHLRSEVLRRRESRRTLPATKGSCRKGPQENLQLAPCLHKQSALRGHVALGSPRASPKVGSGGDERHPKKVGYGQNGLEIKNAQPWTGSRFKNKTKSDNERNKPCVTQLLLLSSNPAVPLTGVTGCR